MALSSMTGYGRAEKQVRNLSVEVEMRSVNGRHLTVRSRLPSEWMRLEPQLEALTRRSLRRGAVELVVRIQLAAGARKPEIDQSVLSVYRKALDRMGGGDAAALLRLPGVISLSEPAVSAATMKRLVTAAAQGALISLKSTRAAEGKRLLKVLERELKALGRHLAVVKRRLPQALEKHQEALHRRLASLLKGAAGIDRDSPVLMRELAAMADRSDVTEELDRLDSHMGAFQRTLRSDAAVGRELDFLLQEMGREVNTLGAKALDASVSERVVRMKGCVERLREQVANIE